MPTFFALVTVLLLGAVLVYVAGRLWKRHWRIPQILALGALALAWVFYVDAALAGDVTFRFESIAVRFDGIASLLAALTLTLGTLVVLFSGTYLSGHAHTEKFFALLLILLAVLIALGAAGDLFNLWVWFETLAVSSYVLVAFHRDQNASLEAGVKYLVQGAAGSVLVLLGIAIVLGTTGTLDLEAIGRSGIPGSPSSMAVLAAVALFVIGFGVKASLVPLHTWLPDAHAQAPSGISALLSGVVIEAGLIAMLRVISPLSHLFNGQESALPWLLMGFGVVNMLVGNLLALRQTQVKRLLAFSSVAQVGYIIFGFGISFWSGQGAGAQAAFFQLWNHGLMKGLAFLAAGAMLYALHTALGNHAPLTISDLGGAARRYPVAAFALSVAVLGLAGLPLLAGFMSKWQIFIAGFDTQNVWIDALVIFAALNSVLALAYYTPLVNVMYRGEPSPVVRNGARLTWTMTAPLIVLTLSIFIIGIAPNVMSGLTRSASLSLMHSLGY